MGATSDLWLFTVLVFGVMVLPGMDMAYVTSNALLGGLRGALAALGGIVVGGIVHVAVAMTGIAAVLSLWPAAFNAMLLAGSAYMLWVGWSILRSAPAADGEPTAMPASTTPLATVFRRAVVTCLLNPKAYAFTLAVFPAFARSADRPLWVQGLLLGAIIAVTQVLVYGVVAFAACTTGRLAGPGGVQRAAARVMGPLLMVCAAVTPFLAWKPVHAAQSPVSTVAVDRGDARGGK